ncbi:MAG TPA: hypothetical protein VNS59_05700 [Lysobacter sp.]|nr:hypothetical protein [Lysobacter sp.]
MYADLPALVVTYTTLPSSSQVAPRAQPSTSGVVRSPSIFVARS